MNGTVEYKFVSTGVDWITVTTTSCNASSFLSTFASKLIREEHHRGNMQRGWGMAGFNGWACGQVQFGIRDDSAMVRLSGDAAKWYWSKAYKLAENVTRIDLQTTFQVKSGPRKFIRKAHRQAQRWSMNFKRKPTVTLITDNNGGDTLYLGKRQSNVYARLYNKGVESGLEEYRDCVRAECEYKGKVSKAVARRLLHDRDPYSSINLSVMTFFRHRGVVLPITGTPIVYRLPRARTDLDRRLEWLSKACRQSASMAVRFGRSEDLLRALGIRVLKNGELEVMDHVNFKIKRRQER